MNKKIETRSSKYIKDRISIALSYNHVNYIKPNRRLGKSYKRYRLETELTHCRHDPDSQDRANTLARVLEQLDGVQHDNTEN